MKNPRYGFTVVEMLVTLALLTTLLAIPTLSLARERRVAHEAPFERMRRRAVTSGRDTTAVVILGGDPILVTATADGEVLILASLRSGAGNGQ